MMPKIIEPKDKETSIQKKVHLCNKHESENISVCGLAKNHRFALPPVLLIISVLEGKSLCMRCQKAIKKDYSLKNSAYEYLKEDKLGMFLLKVQS